MPFLLPFESTPSYRFSTTILNRQFVFDVRWNYREEAWYFDILDEAEEPIILGTKIVLGAMLNRTRDPAFPRGIIIASDLSNTGQDAGLNDLGDRVQVYFYPEEELELMLTLDETVQ